MVIRRCSGDSFNAATAFEPGFPSFARVLAFARVIEIRATSELEKNAERMTHKTKSRISTASWIIAFHAVLVHADYLGS
jgi:hypothetical protein